jgi:predicted transcriptional regulator
MPRSRSAPDISTLPRREREVLELLLKNGKATAVEITEQLPESPTNSAIRGTLRHLEEKGFVSREWSGPRQVWFPVTDVAKVRKSALSGLLETFFNSSRELALEAMLGIDEKSLTSEDLDRMAALIDEARSKRRRK